MERVASSLQTSWDAPAAGNFCLGGSGTGLAIVAAASAYGSGRFERLAFALAAIAIAAGLLLVWFEIGRPWRAFHVFFHPQTSWMTREALLAPPLLVALAAASWSGERAVGALAAVFALAFLYCQARIPHAALGVPAWREGAILPLFLATGFAEGAGILLVLNAFLGAAEGLFLPVLALLALAARETGWRVYREALERHKAPKRALDALAAIDSPVLYLGTLAPFLLILGAVAFPRLASPLAIAAAALALLSGWVIKGVVITRAGFTEGFAVPPLSPIARLKPERSGRAGWR